MKRAPTSHGLRVTVRHDGDVVDQATHWVWDGWGLAWAAAVTFALVGLVAGATGESLERSLLLGLLAVGALAPLVLPAAALYRRWSLRGSVEGGAILTDNGGPLARYEFVGPDRVRLLPVQPGVEPATIQPGAPWSWRGPHATTVDLDLIPLQRARRWVGGQGDVAFFTTVLMFGVALAQLGFLRDLFLQQGMATGVSVTAEPTPEYIARLLQQDYDGADEGLNERADRMEQVEGNQSFYMPSGNRGPTSRAGGGERAGESVRRVEPEDEALDDTPLADAAEPDDDRDRLEGEIPPPPEPVVDGEPLELDLLGEAPREEPEAEAASDAPPTPMEKFVGWGFRDWLEVRDARPESERQIARHLELMRHRLRIDPQDRGAINMLGYYAYLSENDGLSRETYERYVELYPDDPLGYNNLALTYKRTGEYEQEEALYRKALSMESNDHHVLNNLAVNLAHQGRYGEALDVMEVLEEITPGDPYADLHRAKIYAAMGKRNKALRHLEVALQNVEELDTMHHIEFRQDIRLDPAFAPLRGQDRFRRILQRYYGEDAAYLVSGPDGRYRGGPRG